jgi:hypothetical protein
VQLAADGTVVLYSSQATHVTIDVVGWFGTGAPLRYSSVLPARVVDTRNGTGGITRLADGSPVAVAVGGKAGVPSDAVSVLGTLTVLYPTAPASARMWAAGPAEPAAVDLSVPQGFVRSNLVVPGMSAGAAELAVAPGPADAVLDVVGYFR